MLFKKIKAATVAIALVVGITAAPGVAQAGYVSVQIDGKPIASIVGDQMYNMPTDVMVPLGLVAEVMELEVLIEDLEVCKRVTVQNADTAVIMEPYHTGYAVTKSDGKAFCNTDIAPRYMADGELYVAPEIFRFFKKEVYVARDARIVFISEPGKVQYNGDSYDLNNIEWLYHTNVYGYQLPIVNTTGLTIRSYADTTEDIYLAVDLANPAVDKQFNMVATILENNIWIDEIVSDMEKARTDEAFRQVYYFEPNPSSSETVTVFRDANFVKIHVERGVSGLVKEVGLND